MVWERGGNWKELRSEESCQGLSAVEERGPEGLTAGVWDPPTGCRCPGRRARKLGTGGQGEKTRRISLAKCLVPMFKLQQGILSP